MEQVAHKQLDLVGANRCNDDYQPLRQFTSSQLSNQSTELVAHQRAQELHLNIDALSDPWRIQVDSKCLTGRRRAPSSGRCGNPDDVRSGRENELGALARRERDLASLPEGDRVWWGNWKVPQGGEGKESSAGSHVS